MLYLAAGFILGILINFFPLWQPSAAIEMYPQWHGPLGSVETIEPSPRTGLSKIQMCPVVAEDSIMILSGAGTLMKKRVIRDSLFSVSRSGGHFISYGKAGATVEYFGMEGDRFWKVNSREYPYISYNGKMVLLLKSDHSGIRIFDYNGNPLGARELSGRFVTVISFSEKADNAALGFLDGAYYLIDGRGDIIFQGMTPGGSLVKSAAVAPGGAFGAIHFGAEAGDAVIVVNTRKKKTSVFSLGRVHLAKTALHVDDNGSVTVLDYDRILIANGRGKLTQTLPIPPAITGMASIVRGEGLVMAAYTRREGDAQLLIFSPEGILFYAKTFPGESYLDLSYRRPVILLRGSHSLYCYSLSVQ